MDKDKQASPPIDPEPSASILPMGDPTWSAAFSEDSDGDITRGVGRCLGKYFPHLLKNNFNKILLVDDDPAIHLEFSQILRNSGYIVQHTISEIDAIQIIKDCTPDFLIINWKKSTSSNLPFYESLRRGFIDKYLYIIVMTTEDLVRNKVQMIASGADAFLVKPVPAGELLSLLQAGTRIIEQQLELKKLAMHDPLTGLLNRRTFFEMVKQEWSRAKRHKELFCCASIDLDYCKNINDVYGQIHGDRVLVRAGEIMNRIGRKNDILCRYESDAFYMLLPNTDLQGALICAERLRETIQAEKQFFSEAVSFPTVSIGMAVKTEEMENPEELLEKANEALLWAKQNGRNCVAAYDVSQSAFVAYRTKPAKSENETSKKCC